MTNRLLWLIAVLGLVLVFKGCEEAQAGPKELSAYAAKLGYKASNSSATAIYTASRLYGLDEYKMLKVAIIESSLNPMAYNRNKNGTTDVGLYQINTVNLDNCEAFNIYNVRGNAMCACYLMSLHKKSGDPFYVGRYHSLTESKKIEYFKKVKGL